MSTVIKVENISKQYRLGEIGTGSLSHDINRFFYKLRGKDDPYLKIGEANDRTNKGDSEYVWSLRDISFDIKQGDAVGIIGRNGAGKSTMLKILSRVTAPTTGSIKVKGRIASLLEVGTGFHPDLSGRDNIFLNGAILGMRKHEIKRKFDEIVDFAGVERYIDTPVKRYSSGMYVRLAFAVAAHLESEILIVDEVLAVGDAEFQKKCLGKMGDVRKGEGRTVLFVSHNMAAIKQLCNEGVLLSNGGLLFSGNVVNTLDKYFDLQSSIHINSLSDRKDRSGTGLIKFIEIKFYDANRQEIFNIISGNYLAIECLFENNLAKTNNKPIRLDISIVDKNEVIILQWSTFYQKKDFFIDAQNDKFLVTIPKLNLLVGKYILSLYCVIDGMQADWVQNAVEFTVEAGDYFNNGKVMAEGFGIVASDHEIKLI